MSIVRNVEIDGKQVPFKASAAIPRIYRIKFNRDIYKDLRSLEKAVGEGDENNSNLDLFSLEMFENIAYVLFGNVINGNLCFVIACVIGLFQHLYKLTAIQLDKTGIIVGS